MPVREFTQYVTQAVQSVLQQSHRELELIVIGNEDVEALTEQLPSDERIRIFKRNAPGIVGALNTGLPLCSGDYIARMDSDDICTKDRLRIQLEHAQNSPDVCLVGGCVDIVCDDAPVGNGNRTYQAWLNALTRPEQLRQSCFIESPMPHPTLFAHKDYWTRLQGYRNIAWPEDYDLILRTWLAGIPMTKPENTLLHWREHPNRLTRTDARYSREAFIRAKAWALTQPAAKLSLDEGRDIWICGTGRNARYWHDALIERGASVLGFVELDSAKPKTQKRHLPVIGYRQLAKERKQALVISAISNANAREALSNWFHDQGMESGVDFVLGG